MNHKISSAKPDVLAYLDLGRMQPLSAYRFAAAIFDISTQLKLPTIGGVLDTQTKSKALALLFFVYLFADTFTIIGFLLWHPKFDWLMPADA
ncbi:MAG: hypothetical protein GY742_18970 [Hyphomicrobiales bacterium]|nr:hypothetical protein [Hyphomicrobiales bacterium]